MSKVERLNELSKSVVDVYKEMTNMFCEFCNAWKMDLTELNQTTQIAMVRSNIERMQAIGTDFESTMLDNRIKAEKYISDETKSAKYYLGHKLEVERFVSDCMNLFGQLTTCDGYEYFKGMVDSKEKMLRSEVEKYCSFLDENLTHHDVDAYAKEVMKQVEETRLKMGLTTTKTAEDAQTTTGDNFDWLKDW